MGKKEYLAALTTWVALNEMLYTADEHACYRLLELEREGKARPTFLRRIHSRLNRVRAVRERAELIQ